MPETRSCAFKAGMLIDGTGRSPVENSIVLVVDGKIQQVGPAATVAVPPDCSVVDIAGKTIMPGMFDCHIHLNMDSTGIEKGLFTHKTVALFRAAEFARKTLHAGFTTTRDAGCFNDVGFRQAVEMGLVEGPRIVMAGGIGQTGGHFDSFYPFGMTVPLLGQIPIADGVPDVQREVRKILRQGFDFVKVCSTGGVASPSDAPEYTEWTLAELKAIVHEAKARGREVMAHAEGTQGIKNAIAAGVWSIEHGSFLDDEAIRMLLDHGTYYVPTTYVVERVYERVSKLPSGTAGPVGKILRVRDRHIESFRKGVAAGVRIACGTDACSADMHGANARELECMVKYGLTPMQAIVAATRTSAEACKVDHKTGTLEAGKLADLLVIDGDPLSDITLLQKAERIQLVMKEGVACVDRLHPV